MCHATINVKVSPGIAHQLVSQLVLLQRGWTMNSIQSQNPVNSILQLQHNKQSFTFDWIIKSGESTLMGVHIV